MKSLKNIITAVFLFLLITSLYSVEIEIAGKAGNSFFTSNGNFKKILDFGFNLLLTEDLGKGIHGTLAIQREPGLGNSIWSRIAYNTDWMRISIGPTLGFLNSDKFEKDLTLLFQPGFGTSMSFSSPNGFLATIDTNFAIPLVQEKKHNIYLQDGLLALGWNFPNITALLKISQKAKTIADSIEETYITITDMGFYAVTYSKPSRIRIPLNVFLRINKYEKKAGTSLRNSAGSIIVESGIEHIISSEFEWFINFGAAVFSFSFEKKGEAVKGFFFNAEAGVRFSIGR